jgi:SAM-dependent methyltransferase
VGLAGSPESSSVELLLGPEGSAVLAAAASLGDSLKAGETLRQAWPADLVAAAMTQVELRTRALSKFPAADRMLFTRAGLEQASSAQVAAQRAARFASYTRVVDLCCGIGGDLIGLARVVPDVLAVDRDPVHLRLARYNVEALGLTVRAWLGDVEAVDLTGIEAAFVDPARRTGTQRLWEGSPSLEWCFDLAERLPVAVKAAPGLDHELVPQGWELEFVAVGGDLKESALWSPALATARRRATVMDAVGAHSLVGGDAGPAPVAEPGHYVLDPSPAVTRAGLVAELAATMGAWQLDPMIAFLFADTPTPTPYGKWLKVEASLPWNVRTLADLLRASDVGAVDLRRRGLAGDVEEIRRRLKLSGSRRVTVLMTRKRDQPWAIVGRPVSGPAPSTVTG